jgi:serine phosphatase RsbU (regulator of sigma subunit)
VVDQRQQVYDQLLEQVRLIEADTDPAVVVAHAAGLLAGRVGCRVREAHVHLVDMAAEQGRELPAVAADVLSVLEARTPQTPAGIDSVLRTARMAPSLPAAPPSTSAVAPTSPAGPVNGHAREAAAPPAISRLVEALPGHYTWMTPVRDDAGQVVDFMFAAASPEATDVAGRRGPQLVGLRLLETYTGGISEPVWQAYLQVLADGVPRKVGPVVHNEDAEGVPAESVYTIQVRQLGDGLLISWQRDDESTRQQERIAQTERLGNLGWGVWDLTTGAIEWSDQIYRIYERDPALGPLSDAESRAMNLPEDEPLRAQAVETFSRGETTDVTTRARINGKIKYIRVVADSDRDSAGRPVKIYGIVQDVTARETARAQLAEIEEQLRAHEQSLAAEHALATQLQHIILPIPEEPIDLPGLRVAVRYLPAEQTGRVGGDWYHAAELPDGRALLAVGDVAGHGLQAATTMALLRHALTTLTFTATTEPARLLAHLNRLLYTSVADAGTATTATAVIAVYDPDARILTWAQAGHPAPLLTRDGWTAELDRPAGPLLGAVPQTGYDSAELALTDGDLLLLYTDGLIEHRDRSLREGLAAVMATLNEISAARTEQPLAQLLPRLPRANPNDDTCILAVRPA